MQCVRERGGQATTTTTTQAQRAADCVAGKHITSERGATPRAYRETFKRVYSYMNMQRQRLCVCVPRARKAGQNAHTRGMITYVHIYICECNKCVSYNKCTPLRTLQYSLAVCVH